MRIALPSLAGPRRVLHRIRLVAGPTLGLELPRVEIALHVGLVEVLLPREQRPAADAILGCRLFLALLQPAHQLAHHPARHLLLLRGKGEPVGDEMDEEHLPVPLAETPKQVLPVQLRALAAQEVMDVRAVEPLALLDERLLPDHLLGRHHQRTPAQHLAGEGAAAPVLVDGADAASGGEDEIDEVRAGEGLGEPERVGELGAVAGGRERLEGARDAVLAHEEVEVLGVAPDAGMRLQRVGAPDHGLEALLLENAQGVAVGAAFDLLFGGEALGGDMHYGKLGTRRSPRKRKQQAGDLSPPPPLAPPGLAVRAGVRTAAALDDALDPPPAGRPALPRAVVDEEET